MTALSEYLRDTLKLPESIAQRLEEADRWATKNDGEGGLLAHSWAGDGCKRHCSLCELTYAESWGRPGAGHLACLGRPLR